MPPEYPQHTPVGNSISDVSLIERVRKSDAGAFRTLFERYQPIVFRNTLFHTHDTEVSHDIVQETFLRIWEHRSSLHPHRSILALLLRISVNLVRDLARMRRTRERLEEHVRPPATSEGDNPEEALILSLLEERLAAIINDRLPDRCRSVFLLSRIEGKSNKEIASLLGISVRTVEHQINYALKVMRKQFGGEMAEDGGKK